MEVYTLLWIILLLAHCHGLCLFGEHPAGCVFQCHCQGGAPCNDTTGSCSGGCEAGALGVPWRGPACQTGNVALDKSPRSVHEYWPDEGGLDGRMETCIYTEQYERGWWEVDLGALHKVYNITIYNRDYYRERLSQFWIAVRNASEYTYPDPDDELCHENRMYGNPGKIVHIQCLKSLVGRFIRISKYRDITYDSITTAVSFCEFIVIGNRYFDCSRCPESKHCNDVTGCTECFGAYQPDCLTGCNDGYYGANCKAACGKCRNQAVCDKKTGVCTGGCEMWFTGSQCLDHIVPPVRNSDEIAEVTGRTSSSLEVSWQPLSAVRADLAQFYGYTVYYGISGAGNLRTWPDVTHSENPHVSLTGLNFNTLYDIRIRPYRRMGEVSDYQTPYPALRINTVCGAPERPQLLSADSVIGKEKKNSISIKLVPIVNLEARCDKITRAFIEYKINNQYTKVSIPVDTADFVLDSMAEGSYSIKLTAVNNENISSSSDEVLVTVGQPKRELLISVITPVVVSVIVISAVIVTVVVVLKRMKNKNRSHLPLQQNDISPTEQVIDSNVNDKIVMMDLNSDEGSTKNGEKSIKYEETIQDQEIRTNQNILYHEDADNVYANSAVGVASFEGYVSKKKTNMKKFEDEYETFPTNDESRCKVALITSKDKNRFKNIFPYDDTRVVLTKEPDEISDYINASYIIGYKEPKEYIATQGPLDNTVVDFWKMIWQERVNRIVMVANLKESGKNRCFKYWPERTRAAVDMGPYTIVMEADEVSADYTTRILTLEHKGDVRTVRQFHFTSWEDKNKPQFGATSLHTFFRKVHSFDSTSRNPMVVHCSAGVGRTGTFIALDILLQQARQEKCLDVISWVKKLRADRMFMVQTKEQYFFLHDAIVEFIKCADTGYSCSELQQIFTSLCTSTKGQQSMIEKQFKLLNEFRPLQRNKNRDGLLEINKHKNRNIKIIPDDNRRPYLQGKEDATYINAVFVDSFKAHDSYIVTQMPLSDTVSDFWRLVCEHNCHTIIMLNAVDKADQKYQPYWPSEKGCFETFGQVQVKNVRPNVDKTSKAVNVTELEVTLSTKYKDVSPVCQVRHFQLLTGPSDSELPPNLGDLLDLLDMVQHWQKYDHQTNPRGKTIVHCLDGGSASGLYCAISHTLDRMKVEQEVDVFLAARCIMRSRPQFICTIDQYKFLYETALEYMSRYNDYSNFQ